MTPFGAGTILSRKPEPLGPIICEWGPFDGRIDAWPLSKDEMTIWKAIEGGGLMCVYRDTGRRKKSEDGITIRIFRMVLDPPQKGEA